MKRGQIIVGGLSVATVAAALLGADIMRWDQPGGMMLPMPAPPEPKSGGRFKRRKQPQGPRIGRANKKHRIKGLRP